MKGMRRLSNDEIELYRKQAIKGEILVGPACFEAPLGEWINILDGFALALQIQGKLPLPEDLTGDEHFNAQGLEGKMVLQTNLQSAVIMWAQCPRHRANVYIPMKGGL